VTVAGRVIRPARAGDAAAVASIYNQGIEERIATFETEPRTPEQVAARLHEAAHPAVVVEEAGRILAFAWASGYGTRPCYAGVAEFSVYVDRACRRSGAGRDAVAGLLDACAARGYWKLVSRIFPENLASRRLCAALGFREVGVYHRHGRLEGRWMDCVIVERLLGEALS
jgi:L-amino acid N-acyltransferase YncA